MPLRIFNEVVKGLYAARSMAVVVEMGDQAAMLDIMARHGIIRGVYKNWL